MRVLSVNVALPREITRDGQSVTTAIFKEPVAGRVPLRRLNLDGDRQADLTVHGGPNKAMYVYPSEHYAYWATELPDRPLGWGMLGENLTTEGLLETAVHVGDRFRIGSAEVVVTQPRMPCYKLGIKLGRPEMVERFLASRRSGFYLAVLREGEIGAGDSVELLARDPHQVAIPDVVRVYVQDRDDVDTLQRALQVEALPEHWRERFRKQLAEHEARAGKL
jgi:MOSC domain-containing protein YiiM